VLGRNFELVAFDNKSNPQETVQQLQAAIDRDIRYVLQAAGSNNGHALSDAVAKHNARNPDRAVLYLNFGALDPALTTEKCHFWHFRFVPHGHMIMAALTDAVARNSSIKRVYLIDQDYVWGRSVAGDAREMLSAKRPDIQIVGDDLHQSRVKGLRALCGVSRCTRRRHRDRKLGQRPRPAHQRPSGSGPESQVYAPLAGCKARRLR
jgi:branched-chain amino acid transport system substrate-binding protein